MKRCRGQGTAAAERSVGKAVIIERVLERSSP
jgi:hypothetical protein